MEGVGRHLGAGCVTARSGPGFSRRSPGLQSAGCVITRDLRRAAKLSWAPSVVYRRAKFSALPLARWANPNYHISEATAQANVQRKTTECNALKRSPNASQRRTTPLALRKTLYRTAHTVEAASGCAGTWLALHVGPCSPASRRDFWEFARHVGRLEAARTAPGALRVSCIHVYVYTLLAP